MNLYETIGQYAKEEKKGILARVIQRAGSAPRDVGAMMLIGSDGKCFGTVGGGRLESDTVKEAQKNMNLGETKILHTRMNANAVAEDGMLCGGDVDILLEPVEKRYIEIYQRAVQLEKKGKRGLIVTGFGRGRFSKTLIEQDMKVIGDPLEEEEIKKYFPYIHEKRPLLLDERVIEPVQTFSVLYIFGAGHVSQFLARFAGAVDFHVVVIDDREEFANRDRFPEAQEIIVQDFRTVFNQIEFTGSEFAVIVTRGHQHDADVLLETLKRQTRYVGMIGSRRKVRMVLDYMKECGFADEAIGRVHAPIGLPIHAETPQEIAVSILAELIKVRGEARLDR